MSSINWIGINWIGQFPSTNLEIILRHPAAHIDMAGYIPGWLNKDNPKSLRDQLNDGYAFGGFAPFKGFKMNKQEQLVYAGDPPQRPIVEFRSPNHKERVVVYEQAWVAVIYPDGSFEVCRMD